MHPLQAEISAADVTGRDMDDRILSRVAWRFVPFLFFCYMVAQFDRMNVAFAKFGLERDLGLDDVAYGLGAGIFFIGYILFQIPSNLALRRVGAPIWIAVLMVSWGLLSMAMILVTTPMSFYVLRFLVGAAEAGFTPGVLYYFTLWLPTRRRDKAVGVFMSSIAISGLICGPVSGLLLSVMADVGGLKDWQWLFLLEGFPAVLLGVAAIRLLDRSPVHARWLTADERTRLAVLMAADVPTGSAVAMDLRAGLFSVSGVLLGLLYGTWGMTVFGFIFWLPTILHVGGIEGTLEIGLLSAVPWAATAVAMIGLPIMTSKARSVVPALTLLSVGSAILWAVAASASSLPLMLGSASLAMAANMGSIPIFWRLPAKVFHGAAAAAVFALICVLGNLPGFLSPYLVGWIRSQGGDFTTCFLIFAGTSVGSVVILWALALRERRFL